MSIWRLHNIVSHENRSSHRHRCSLGRMMHNAAKRPNAHYESQTTERPSNSKQSDQAMREGSANGDIISRFSNSVISDWNKKSNNVKLSMAQ